MNFVLVCMCLVCSSEVIPIGAFMMRDQHAWWNSICSTACLVHVQHCNNIIVYMYTMHACVMNMHVQEWCSIKVFSPLEALCMFFASSSVMCRECAVRALEDVKKFLLVEGGQVAVSCSTTWANMLLSIHSVLHRSFQYSAPHAFNTFISLMWLPKWLIRSQTPPKPCPPSRP